MLDSFGNSFGAAAGTAAAKHLLPGQQEAEQNYGGMPEDERLAEDLLHISGDRHRMSRLNRAWWVGPVCFVAAALIAFCVVRSPKDRK